jgi:hypothetical protein
MKQIPTMITMMQWGRTGCPNREQWKTRVPTLEFDETEIDLSSSTLTDALADAPLISDVPRATADVAMAAQEEEGGSFVLGKWLA